MQQCHTLLKPYYSLWQNGATSVAPPCAESFGICRVPVTVTTIYRDDDEVQAALGGENLRLRLSGVDEDDIAPGFVICSRNTPVPCVTYFDAQLQVSRAAISC